MSDEKINALTMPKWGLSMTEGKILEWIINEGDEVKSGDEILEVETEKISSAVESPFTGKLIKIVTEPGETVPVGGLLAVIGDATYDTSEVDDYITKFQAEFVPEIKAEDDGQDIYSWAELGDHSIRYLDTGAGSNIVLLIHGFGGDLGNWVFNYEAIGEGRRVIMLDLPGHGESTKAVGDADFEFFADIIKEFIDYLNIDNVNLIGHSMGGAVSIAFAVKYAETVKSMVLIAPAGIGPEINADYISGFVDSNSRRDLKPNLEKLFIDKSLVTRQFVDDMLKFKRIDGVQDCLKKIQLKLLDDFGNQSTILLDKLQQINIPTKIIWGRNDEIIPSEQLLKVPDKNHIQILSIDESGHMLQLEEYNKINAEINNFLP